MRLPGVVVAGTPLSRPTPGLALGLPLVLGALPPPVVPAPPPLSEALVS